jgi:hypothetical protein
VLLVIQLEAEVVLVRLVKMLQIQLQLVMVVMELLLQ